LYWGYFFTNVSLERVDQVRNVECCQVTFCRSRLQRDDHAGSTHAWNWLQRTHPPLRTVLRARAPADGHHAGLEPEETMTPDSRYFPLSLDSLRALATWAADCAARALTVCEGGIPPDPRPRAAIEGTRLFAAGGPRTAQLRRVSLAAFAAAREAGTPAATAAARAAGLAASSAYTHPLADVQQTRHIVGPAAYAALALELDGGDSAIADEEVSWALAHMPPEVREILLHMPAREMGKTRLEKLMYKLDVGIRGVYRHDIMVAENRKKLFAYDIKKSRSS